MTKCIWLGSHSTLGCEQQQYLLYIQYNDAFPPMNHHSSPRFALRRLERRHVIDRGDKRGRKTEEVGIASANPQEISRR